MAKPNKPEDGDSSELNVTTPAGSFGFKGKQVVEILLAVVLALLASIGVMVWDHRAEARSEVEKLGKGQTAGLERLAAAITAQTQALNSNHREQATLFREQLCLLSLPQAKREQELMGDSRRCRRIAEGQ
jgi:hypothetical protein